MMVYYIVYHLFNDLVNKANSNHTHSNYVTSSQVVSIVNSNIQSGVIQVSSGYPFSRVEHYSIKKLTKTFIGPGYIHIFFNGTGETGSYISEIDGNELNFAYIGLNGEGSSRLQNNNIYFNSSITIVNTASSLILDFLVYYY